MIHKLRCRFVRIAMFSVSLVILILCLSINLVNFLSTNAELENMLCVIHENQGMVPDVPRDGKFDNRPRMKITPETPFSTRFFVLRYDADGVLISMDLRHIAAVTQADGQTYLNIALKHGEGFGYSCDYKYYVTGENNGQYMAIFLECQRELRAVRMFALFSGLIGVVCIALVYILVMLFSKRAIDPVVKSVERQKQFITDASHELKTPLTVITTSLKVLEMDVGEHKWIDKIRGQAEQMSELVNSLVTLSRLDEERPALNIAEFDLSEAVRETAESFQDFVVAQGHMLELDILPGVIYTGDEYAIRQLVSILLDNGVKYADQGSTIRLDLERYKRSVIICMSNICTGMDCRELDRLFDRFYRVEKSRSRQTGGFGVGLSIARSIAEAHRGSIRAELRGDDMIQFVTTLPDTGPGKHRVRKRFANFVKGA